MVLISDFKAQVGERTHPGFLSQPQRLASIREGENPFVTGTALPENSPVFVGRAHAERAGKVYAAFKGSPSN